MELRPSRKIMLYAEGDNNPVNPGIEWGEIPEPKEENDRIGVAGCAWVLFERQALVRKP